MTRTRLVSSLTLVFASLSAAACSSTSTNGSTPTSGSPNGGSPNATTDGGSTNDGSRSADSGSSANASANLGSGPYAIAYAGTEIGVDQRMATSASLDGVKLTAYTASDEESPALGTNSVLESGGDGAIVWGRWAGGAMGGKYYTAPPFNFAPNGGLHYALGAPTTTLPSSGGGAWSVAGKTSATVSDGSSAVGTIDGTMNVAFAGAGTKVGLALTLTIPGDTTYTVATTGGTQDPSASQVIMGDGALFRSATSDIRMSGGNACAGGGNCVATIVGFFAGQAADRAGVVVHIFAGTGGAPKTVSGAIVFKKN